MKKPAKLGICFVVAAIIFYIAYFCYMFSQENRLAQRALSIRKGMQVEEVVGLMGNPVDEGIIDAAAVSRGWAFEWHREYENLMKKYDKVFLLKYFVRYIKLPLLGRREGTVRVDVCFSPIEMRVIYVSKYFSTG